MWPFTKRPKPEPERDVAERLDDLEDDVKHINRRFTRLQQQVTRWAREYDEDLDDDDVEDDEVMDEIRKRRANG
jgi:hypothetical protein